MYSYSIMNDLAGHEEEICLDIKRQYDGKIADLALFSVAITPENTPPIPKAKNFVDKYTVYRDKLAEMGAECGILAQATVGHGYKMHYPMPFTRYIGAFDDEPSFASCPLDEDFRAYLREAMATFASARPRMIMVDDDFRLIARRGRGCACPLHMKRLGELLGREISVEELRARLVGKGDEDVRVTEAFIATQGEALIGAAVAMREGIDSVDPTLQGAFCCCGNSAEFAGEVAEIIAGKGNPVIVRINNGNYTPAGAKGLSVIAERAATQMAAIRGKVSVSAFLAETDTCPQSRYSTSAHNLHAHYAATILEGASGAKHWITRLANFEPRSGEAYRKMLSKYSGYYTALAELYPKLEFVGCRIPLCDKPFYNLDPRIESFNAPFMSGWSSCVIERMGIPLYFSENAGGVCCFDGDTDFKFTDGQIMEMLSGAVLLDGACARRLCERGFSQYLGVRCEEWDGGTPSGDSFIHEGGRCNAPVDPVRLVPLSDDTVTDSVIYRISADGERINVAPSVTVFENSLGGKVIVYAGVARTQFHYTKAFSLLNQPRKAQLCRLLGEAGALPVYYDGDAEVYMKAARIKDEAGKLALAVFNIGLDPLDEITLKCEGTPSRIEYLTPDGEYREVGFTASGGTVTAELPLMTLEPQVLIITLAE